MPVKYTGGNRPLPRDVHNKFGVGVGESGGVYIADVERTPLTREDVENLIAYLFVMSNADRENVDRLIAEIER